MIGNNSQFSIGDESSPTKWTPVTEIKSLTLQAAESETLLTFTIRGARCEQCGQSLRAQGRDLVESFILAHLSHKARLVFVCSLDEDKERLVDVTFLANGDCRIAPHQEMTT